MRGVSSLQEEWLDQHPDDNVAVFVVWSDQLGAAPDHVPDAAELMPDERAQHYWDAEKLLGRAYQRSLVADDQTFDLDAPAWDVWLLFDEEARWGEKGPPQPAWWEHQLGGGRLPAERRLDPRRFAAKVAELLGPAETADRRARGSDRG